jgi:hypothetical protein
MSTVKAYQGVRAVYNSDLSGLRFEADTPAGYGAEGGCASVEVPAELLFMIVGEYLNNRKIAKLEQADYRQALGLPRAKKESDAIGYNASQLNAAIRAWNDGRACALERTLLVSAGYIDTAADRRSQVYSATRRGMAAGLRSDVRR